MRRALVLLIAGAIATGAAGATISGTVRQLESASPLPSMSVAAYDAAGALRATLVTDAQGRYTMTLGDGTYRLLAYDSNGVYATSFYDDAEFWFDTSHPFAIAGAQAVTPVDFALARGGFIAGLVTAATSPLPSITVAAYNLSGTLRGFTKTNASGLYHLVLPAGTYKVAAFDEARVYATSFHAHSASFGSAVPVGVTANGTTTIAFPLSTGARIRGRAADSSCVRHSASHDSSKCLFSFGRAPISSVTAPSDRRRFSPPRFTPARIDALSGESNSHVSSLRP